MINFEVNGSCEQKMLLTKIFQKLHYLISIPEHVDLGLRLTVGEGALNKPFLRSTHGDGHFPEMSAQTEPSPNAYFPAMAGFPGT